MGVAKSGSGEETETAMTAITTVAVTGTAVTAVARRQRICTVKIVSVWIPHLRARHVALHATKPAGKGTRHVMIKITTVVAVGMAETAVAAPKF